MLKKILNYLSILFTLTIPLAAIPPRVPGAGVVERELEQEFEGQTISPDDRMNAIQIDLPEEKLEMPEGKKVFISHIDINGNECVPNESIISWIDSYLGQDLSLKDIYELCSVIDQNYAKQGHVLARAYPPPQIIVNGILAIEIIEGKLGNVLVEGNKYYSTEFIRSYFYALQGKPFQYDKFLRALLLLNDNPDLIAGAVFAKGEEFGTGDVILRIEDDYPAHLYLNANNYGRDLTTNTRAGARLDWGNLFTYGDMFSIAEVVGFPWDALYFTDINYTLPLNRKGTFLEFAYLSSKFKIEELQSLHLRGRSDIATIKVSHALIRKRFLSLDIFSYFDFKQIQNFVLDHRSSFDKLRVLTFGALIDQFNPCVGRNYLTLSMSIGIPDFLGGLKAKDDESSRKGAGGRFFKLNVDYDWLQHLPRDSFFYFHGSGQWSPNKLTLPEVFYIGGDNTVRGFPLAVALGDSGYYFNCELRFPPPFLANKQFFMLNKTYKEIFQFDAFLDHGGVFNQSSKHTFLWGSGVGVRIKGPYNLTFSIDVGFPLNNRKLTREAFVYIKLTAQPF